MAKSEPVDVEKWRVQLRKGAAELAVLGILLRGTSYGSKLLDDIADARHLDVSEGSIYPLLKRLEKDGKVISKWVEDPGASHPRKYYELTARGRKMVDAMRTEWFSFSRGMSSILGPDKGS